MPFNARASRSLSAYSNPVGWVSKSTSLSPCIVSTIAPESASTSKHPVRSLFNKIHSCHVAVALQTQIPRYSYNVKSYLSFLSQSVHNITRLSDNNNIRAAMPKLSVLMAIYQGDRPDWLEECLQSLESQTRPADQIIVVHDGPVSQELMDVLERFRTRLALESIALPRNVGLGAALRTGLEHCSHELVARMDADDICVPHRFEKQLSYFEENPDIDIVGAWIGEFDPASAQRIYALRRVPELHAEIVRFAHRRNPFNHMTVMFKRTAIERAGSYRAVRGLEDYDLWARLLRSSAKAANIAEPLVWARAGDSLATRRGGLGYLFREYMLIHSFYASGFIGKSDLVITLTSRTFVRLVPAPLRTIAYRGIRLFGSFPR